MNKQRVFTRRSFLTTSIASIATLALVPRHVLGGPGFTPPSEILTRAVIGTGGMGMGHVKSINTASNSSRYAMSTRSISRPPCRPAAKE